MPVLLQRISDNDGASWLLMYMCVLAYAISLQCIPPSLSLIISDLHLSHARAGALMSFFALPAILVSISAGMLADLYGHRAIGITSLILTDYRSFSHCVG